MTRAIVNITVKPLLSDRLSECSIENIFPHSYICSSLLLFHKDKIPLLLYELFIIAACWKTDVLLSLFLYIFGGFLF